MFYGVFIILIIIIVLCFWITQPLIFINKIESGSNTDAEKLQKHVEKISNEFYPRSHANLNNLNKTADYIKSEFEKSGGKVSEQKYRLEGSEFRNIIVKFGEESGDRLIVGAHYDSCGDTVGADDNASGVAGLIELAHQLGKDKITKQIELVAYTLEEPPYFATTGMGSYVHAKSLRDNNVKVSLMISLEMIGYFSDEENSQDFPVSILKLFYPTKGNFISIVGNFMNGLSVRKVKSAMQCSGNLPVYSTNVPKFIPGVDFSDHRNYWIFGYDAIMVTDTAFYRNKNYHTTADTPEKLDYNKMAKVVDGVYKFIKTF